MSDDIPVPQLQMVWPQRLLDQPPAVELPAGYALRAYRPGDEPRFYELMHLAGWADWDAEKLPQWLFRMLPEGWLMVVEETGDQIVASAMATHDPTWHLPFSGEVGWVATDPAHRGQGLGTAVVAAVTARFIDIGYPHIHLYTEHYRLPALKVYLQLGYMPVRLTPETAALWQEACAQLDWPYTPELWAQATR